MDSPRRPVKTVDTTIEILYTLVDSHGMTLSEIANATGLAESTVHRHLETLVANELITRDDKEYRLSFKFLDVGTRIQHRHPLYIAGREYIDELAAETGERVWLSTIENGNSVSLYWRSQRKPLRQHSRVGTRRPLHVSAVGKAMLAELPEDEVRSIIDQQGLPARTENTITDREALFEELQRIRENGYSVSRGETVEGMNAVAVAISDEKADILGGIVIGCSASRMDDSVRDQFVEKLWETADELAIRTRFS